jgi:hypothetical protein
VGGATPFRQSVLPARPWEEGEEGGAPPWAGILTVLEPGEILRARFLLAWQPLFGASLRIGWEETERLTPCEMSELLNMSVEERRIEWRHAFPRR